MPDKPKPTESSEPVINESLHAGSYPEPQENLRNRRPLDGESLLEDMEPDDDEVDFSGLPGYKPYGKVGNT
jgi:hypothetical protein